MRRSLGLLSSGFWALLGLLPTAVFAQVFDGPGLKGGVNAANGINGPIHTDPRTAVVKLLAVVLNYIALASVVMVVIAGIFLITSAGNEESKNRAKKILIYLAIGLVVVLLARVGVSFFLIALPQTIS